MESGYPVNAKHAELERRSAQLRLKAAEMLGSSTRLVKSHGDGLDQEDLWNRNEYGSLENSLKAMEKMPNMEDNQKLSTSACYKRDQSLFTVQTQTKALYLANFLMIALA